MTTYFDENQKQKTDTESVSVSVFPPNKIPIIVEPEGELPFFLDQNKFLVPDYFTVHELLFHLRRRLQLPKTHAIFLLINGKQLAKLDTKILNLYEECQEKDKILYIKYLTEPTLGSF
ncbi:unnamed protein product [Blepharisma stoltei]|uniref:Autophagy-related protein n=1 Tax=Blepharisma stoltei TaxID=1481888 RepID=A0AAU9J4B4_9CILI|nr:unnamed protein product [Blepharisma stoltei]